MVKCEHNKDKYYCRDCGGKGICIHNNRKRECKQCGGSSICTHGNYKKTCKECGGSQICIHNKIKYSCKECGGNGICIHNKDKNRCKECGGKRLCIHNKDKELCKECDGSALCIHDIRKSRCKECKGIDICEHGNYKYYCKECGGNGICIHNKNKSQCKECKGSLFCKHNKRKSCCKECQGSAICKHNIIKYYCKECGGTSLCIHGKKKSRCKECGGNQLCKTPLCETRSIKKYDGYCLRCYIHLFPDKPVIRNYKTKERSVVEFVLNTFLQYDWVEDKKVEDGCSRRRPDLLLDLGYQIIIIEIDETQHRDYDCSCENKRIMEISKDLGHRPIIFLRFNPDEYFDEEGNIIKSCWKINKSGICTIDDKKEWDNRLNSLKLQVEYWCNPENKTEKTIETIHMYYDECEIDTESEEYDDEELSDDDIETNDNIMKID